MSFQHTRLPNGLEIIAETRASAFSAAVGVFVQAGARDESPEVAGVSHFLEHMLFKGTPTRSAADVNRLFDEMGASANAFTSEEQTVYYASVLPELADRAVDLLGDMMRPSLDETEFETEKQVILEEIMMYEDQPPFGADEKSRELFFAGHPLAHSVLGSRESIAGLNVEAMRSYHAARYVPENLLIVGCGRIDFERFVREVERVCGDMAPSPHRSAGGSPDFRRTLERTAGKAGGGHPDDSKYTMFKPSATQQYTFMLSNGPGATDPCRERCAALLLAGVLGDEVGSRLYWELIDNGRADSAWLGSYEYLDAGLYTTVLVSDPETAEANRQITLDIYRDAGKNGITTEELERARNKILSRTVLANERPRERLFAVGNEWFFRGRYNTIREDLDALRAVSTDDVHTLLEKYPLSAPFTVQVRAKGE